MSEKIDPVPQDGPVSRDQVRALFPEVTAVADKIRAEFGNGVKLVYAEEHGRCIGKRSVVDPDGLVKLSEMVLDSRPYAEIVAEREKGMKRAK
ncbi:hypothetical protein [Nitrosomonas oligotropha]|uniref:hypothetical protein n=1 Tax=Nitrosomonas oligotropha TaxID=42354 RepID=UPI00136876B8|nr:hypothetical protein [Nitrosomonas oligotropha]MXS81560.1 hypothetical protein [Nitrosomonas oligotropha]